MRYITYKKLNINFLEFYVLKKFLIIFKIYQNLKINSLFLIIIILLKQTQSEVVIINESIVSSLNSVCALSDDIHNTLTLNDTKK